ncbi:unannotated protein [freshwater metagenome]|uniref:Unannotated protein n=1 Tax=freshwater metagenome TaxID=449393 RepID=A0A6J6P1E4_9ZZZZ
MRVMPPAISKPMLDRRCVSVSQRKQNGRNARASTPCARNTPRQLRASTIGPPKARPRAGAAAETNAHMPRAFGRASSGNVSMMSATAVGAVAKPAVWLMVRKMMSEPAFHDSAVRIAAAPHTVRPIRKTRRCPLRSPSRPKVGSMTAPTSIGSESTHESVEVDASRLSPISGSAATRMTAGQPETKTPSIVATSTRRCFPLSTGRGYRQEVIRSKK